MSVVVFAIALPRALSRLRGINGTTPQIAAILIALLAHAHFRRFRLAVEQILAENTRNVCRHESVR